MPSASSVRRVYVVPSAGVQPATTPGTPFARPAPTSTFAVLATGAPIHSGSCSGRPSVWSSDAAATARASAGHRATNSEPTVPRPADWRRSSARNTVGSTAFAAEPCARNALQLIAYRTAFARTITVAPANLAHSGAYGARQRVLSTATSTAVLAPRATRASNWWKAGSPAWRTLSSSSTACDAPVKMRTPSVALARSDACAATALRAFAAARSAFVRPSAASASPAADLGLALVAPRRAVVAAHGPVQRRALERRELRHVAHREHVVAAHVCVVAHVVEGALGLRGRVQAAVQLGVEQRHLVDDHQHKAAPVREQRRTRVVRGARVRAPAREAVQRHAAHERRRSTGVRAHGHRVGAPVRARQQTDRVDHARLARAGQPAEAHVQRRGLLGGGQRQAVPRAQQTPRHERARTPCAAGR